MKDELIIELKKSVRAIDILFRENKTKALTEYGHGVYDMAKRIIDACEDSQNG